MILYDFIELVVDLTIIPWLLSNTVLMECVSRAKNPRHFSIFSTPMSATLVDFAQRLQIDINRRGLVPGTKYLTAQESALLLGTSVATANRVLRLLADKEIVVRRRNSGTFVGPAVVQPSSGDIRTVSILGPVAIRSQHSPRLDLVIEAILACLPDVADVRVSYVPSVGGVDFVRGLLEPILESGQLAGVVAISCPRDVYRFLGENQYPLVVMGSLYPDQPYPSIDTDEMQAGRLLVSYLVDRGHRRLALFSDSEDCPGDNYFHDGVSEALTTARLPHNALVLRTPGTDPAVLKAQVSELVRMEERPTGIIVKAPEWADAVREAVNEHALVVPQDIEIVFRDGALDDRDGPDFPHARPSISTRGIAHLAGQMLAQVRRGDPLEQRARVIPYEMQCAPEPGSQQAD